ncbi:MAG: hypothetical protein AAGC43_08935 [Bacteroidota bacterium]
MSDEIDYKKNFDTWSNFWHVPKDGIVSRLNYISDMLEPEHEGLNKVQLGEFYYYKYINKLIALAKEVIEEATEHIKSNNLDGDDKSNVEYPILRLKDLIQKTVTTPNYLKGEDKPEVLLSDFFTDKVNEKIIKALQKEFENLRGKEMAILIHLLNELEMVLIDNNDRKYKSRLSFVRKLTNSPNLKRGDSINKHLDYDNNFKGINIKDPKYIQIKDKLEKVVSSR